MREAPSFRMEYATFWLWPRKKRAGVLTRPSRRARVWCSELGLAGLATTTMRTPASYCVPFPRGLYNYTHATYLTVATGFSEWLVGSPTWSAHNTSRCQRPNGYIIFCLPQMKVTSIFLSFASRLSDGPRPRPLHLNTHSSVSMLDFLFPIHPSIQQDKSMGSRGLLPCMYHESASDYVILMI